MVIERKGLIFSTQAPVILNPVNCQGVMGAGLALEFKHRAPDNFEAYKKACEREMLRPGGIFPYQGKKLILNAATKDKYKGKSNIVWVSTILGKIKRHYTHVALPYLGAGLGGISESLIEIMVKEVFAEDPFTKVELWQYDETAFDDPIRTKLLQHVNEYGIEHLEKAFGTEENELAETLLLPNRSLTLLLRKYPRLYTLTNI